MNLTYLLTPSTAFRWIISLHLNLANQQHQCLQPFTCRRTQIQPESLHNTTVSSLMYVCHTRAATFHPSCTLTRRFLSRIRRNFLLKGDVCKSQHFNGFETLVKVWWVGFPPSTHPTPQSRPIVFIAKTTLILQQSIEFYNYFLQLKAEIFAGSSVRWMAAQPAGEQLWGSTSRSRTSEPGLPRRFPFLEGK